MKKNGDKLFFIISALLYVFLAVFVMGISFLFFESSAYSYMHRNFTAQKTGSDNIVLVVIDDKSIEQYRWPWKRSLYAKILEYLNDYSNPKLIGLDALITSEDDPQSDNIFYSVIAKSDKLVAGFSPMVKDFPQDFDGDKYFKKFSDKYAINITDFNETNNFIRYRSISKFPDAYFNALKYAGSVNTTQNMNGTIIWGDQTVRVRDKNFPSLALRMYLKLNNTNKVQIIGNNVLVEDTSLVIPVVRNASGTQSLTHYYKFRERSDYSHKTYSAVDIINSFDNIKKGKTPVIDPKEFDGKIVLIGAMAKASGIGLDDTLQTPMFTKHPGVDIQATCLDNLINDEFVEPANILRDLLILIIWSIVALFVITHFSFFKSLIGLIIAAIIYEFIAALCFAHNIQINVITPLAVQLITMIFGYSYRFILEGRNKEKIKQAMGKYLSQDIMQNVVKNIDDIKLGGKKAVVTVLFSDIRGFTRISEQLSAEEVSVILNEYFTEIEPIISKYNGVINKFIGDAVMAIFGEPIQDVNHAKNAVLCANEMLKAVDKLRDKWLFEGKPKIEIGIGINTGEAFVGNIGSEKRLEYTVIGDMVNVASRIESYNKVYKTNFLISSSTYEQVSDVADVIKISEVQIRGKSKKMDIYEVLRLT